MPESRSLTIAIVDDDADSRLLASTITARAGHRPIEDDGAIGLALRLVDLAPDLVLLDLHLVGRTGAHALDEIRAEPALRDVPIIACSGARHDDDVFIAVSDLVRAHVPKPVEPDRLLAAIADATGTPVSHAEDDIAALRTRFRHGLVDRLARIDDAVTNGDHERLTHELHRLRGAAGGYGFTHLADASARVEHALREKQPLTDTIDRVRSIIRSLVP
jgi:CheY-like chemotaxis protein